MKQEYYHFEQPTKWPKFIYDTMAEIQDMKTQSGNQITKEIYNKTVDVAVWMARFDTNNKVTESLNNGGNNNTTNTQSNNRVDSKPNEYG